MRLQSIKVAHIYEDFSPRISRISRMGSPFLFIRVIREIRDHFFFGCGNRAPMDS
jgi:hypothetical protein